MASSINASTSGGGGVIVSSDATGNLNLQSGGTTVVAVTSAGVAVTGTLSSSGASTFTGTGKFATTIGVGNATPSASGSGITFPATQSASSDANTLDDYEEGTWTPTIAFGGASVGVTYTRQTGTYTKVGNVVTVVIDLRLSSIGSSTGAFTILGLPFTSSAAGIATGALYLYSGFTGIKAMGIAYTSGSTSLNEIIDSASVSLTNSNVTNSAIIFTTTTYRT